MGYLIFDSDIRTDGIGVVISGPAVYNAPARSYEMIQIPGRSGDIALDMHRIENIEIAYPAFITGNLKERAERLRNGLTSRIGYKRLWDSYNPEEFRLAVYQGGIDFDTTPGNRAAYFDIVFNCKPQRFLLSGENEQTFTADGDITNPTAYPAAPLLAITGAGTVGIGGHTIDITGPTNRVTYIDCDVMDAWYISGGAKVPNNSNITYSGDEIPTIPAGTAAITMDGPSRVKITPRWWKL